MVVKYSDLKNSLRVIREFKGITQKQLSQETELSQSAVSYVEINHGSSSIDTINRICKALGYELRFVLIPKKEAKKDQSNTLANE